MNRFLSLLLSCMLLLCPLALAENQALQSSPYPGVWIENEGYGTLTILADGTARMDYYDATVTECHWELTETGARFTDGQWLNSPMKLLEENTLSVADGWMVFTREGFLPITDEALLLDAQPVGEEGVAFLGKWELTSIIMEGETFDPALFGMTMTLTFQDNGLVITDDGMEPYTTTWFVSYGNAVVEGDILSIDEDGKLIYHSMGDAMIFTPIVPEVTEPEATEPETTEPEVTEPETTEPEIVFTPVGEEGAPFLGLWTLEMIDVDGMPMDPALFGMNMSMTFEEDGSVLCDDGMDVEILPWHVENGAAIVDGMALTISDEGKLLMSDGGDTMIFAPGEGAPAEELSEADQLLALLELLELLEGTGDDLSALPEHHQGFVGEWQLCYLMTGGLSGDLRPLGITGQLVLNADYTGWLTGIADEDATWYEDEEGVIRFGESGMPMFLIPDADGISSYLQYGTEAGGYMIFHQDAEAVWTPGLCPLQSPASTAESAAPAAPGDFSAVGTRFVCTSYTAGGVTNDASILGVEYAVVFREDGLADFTMAGFTMTDLGCTVADDGTRTIHYAGSDFPCVPTESGFDMDYFGIIYHMAPAE